MGTVWAERPGWVANSTTVIPAAAGIHRRDGIDSIANVSGCGFPPARE